MIPPWNFPAAIMAGMTLASIVCGNTVILKPSSDSPTIAAKFIEILESAGMPEGVVNFCPGAGASFGDAVVAHPKTRYIAFTGSREVGLRINKVAADVLPVRFGSSAPSLRWEARTRSSLTPTPIWRRSQMVLPLRHLDSRGKNVRLVRA